MKLSLASYIRYLRRQKVHIQHMHAIAFAGVITVLLAATILYVQYGYWHATYERGQELPSTDETVITETPKETLVRLFEEGKNRFKQVSASFSPLEGGEVTFDRNATTTK